MWGLSANLQCPGHFYEFGFILLRKNAQINLGRWFNLERLGFY
jgi:hypothetical protein